MPEWIEKLTETQARAKKQLPEIPVAWESTTIPALPDSIHSLPIAARLSVTSDGIQISAKRVGFITHNSVEEVSVILKKEDIVGIDIILMPEMDDSEMGEVSFSDRSRAVIRHRDPFDVISFFESTFSSLKPYWMKALAKVAKERLGVEATVSEIHAKS